MVVNKFLREDYPDNEMVEVDIKAEKFIVSYMCIIIDTSIKCIPLLHCNWLLFSTPSFGIMLTPYYCYTAHKTAPHSNVLLSKLFPIEYFNSGRKCYVTEVYKSMYVWANFSFIQRHLGLMNYTHIHGNDS